MEELTVEMYQLLNGIDKKEYINVLKNIPIEHRTMTDKLILSEYTKENNEAQEQIPEGFKVPVEEYLRPNKESTPSTDYRPAREYRRTGSSGVFEYQAHMNDLQRKQCRFKIRNVPQEFWDARDKFIYQQYWTNEDEREFIEGNFQQVYVAPEMNIIEVFDYLSPKLGIYWSKEMDELKNDDAFISRYSDPDIIKALQRYVVIRDRSKGKTSAGTYSDGIFTVGRQKPSEPVIVPPEEIVSQIEENDPSNEDDVIEDLTTDELEDDEEDLPF